MTDHRPQLRPVAYLAAAYAAAGETRQADGLFAEAHELVPGLRDRPGADWDISHVAIALADANRIEEALRFVETTIPRPFGRWVAMRGIAKSAVRAGRTDIALRLADTTNDRGIHDVIHHDLARRLTERGMYRDAVEHAERIRFLQERAEALAEIALQMIRTDLSKADARLILLPWSELIERAPTSFIED